MKSLHRIAIVAALAIAVAPVAQGSQLWLHVRVTETGSRPTTVRVNVPYTLVERVAPLVDKERIDDGEIDWNGDRVAVAELRENWKALRSGKGTITKDDATWALVRDESGETLVVKETGGAEPTEVRIPARLVDALLSGSDRLDFEAATKVVAELGAGELLAVDEDGTKVRIWVDTTPEAE
jgi:hypothetical protein